MYTDDLVIVIADSHSELKRLGGEQMRDIYEWGENVGVQVSE